VEVVSSLEESGAPGRAAGKRQQPSGLSNPRQQTSKRCRPKPVDADEDGQRLTLLDALSVTHLR
jgi:hypothetical protein